MLTAAVLSLCLSAAAHDTQIISRAGPCDILVAAGNPCVAAHTLQTLDFDFNLLADKHYSADFRNLLPVLDLFLLWSRVGTGCLPALVPADFFDFACENACVTELAHHGDVTWR